MILVDTSVWIDYLNGNPNKFTDQLDSSLFNGDVILGDLIFLEILQGIKSDRDYKRVKAMLNSLEQYEMLGHSAVEKCAENYRYLRKNGMTIRKTTDVIIATFCIDNKIPLLFSDRDFLPFVKKLGLVAVL